MTPSSSSLDSAVAERMDIRKDVYTASRAHLDDWERYDPKQPLDDQNYNRKIVKDQDRKLAYVYVAGKKTGEYLLKMASRSRVGTISSATGAGYPTENSKVQGIL